MMKNAGSRSMEGDGKHKTNNSIIKLERTYLCELNSQTYSYVYYLNSVFLINSCINFSRSQSLKIMIRKKGN